MHLLCFCYGALPAPCGPALLGWTATHILRNQSTHLKLSSFITGPIHIISLHLGKAVFSLVEMESVYLIWSIGTCTLWIYVWIESAGRIREQGLWWFLLCMGGWGILECHFTFGSFKLSGSSRPKIWRNFTLMLMVLIMYGWTMHSRMPFPFWWLQVVW